MSLRKQNQTAEAASWEIFSFSPVVYKGAEKQTFLFSCLEKFIFNVSKNLSQLSLKLVEGFMLFTMGNNLPVQRVNTLAEFLRNAHWGHTCHQLFKLMTIPFFFFSPDHFTEAKMVLMSVVL